MRATLADRIRAGWMRAPRQRPSLALRLKTCRTASKRLHWLESVSRSPEQEGSLMDASQVLRELNETSGFPVEAICAAQDNRDAMTPLFLQCIDDCLASGGASPLSSALFFIFHLLG